MTSTSPPSEDIPTYSEWVPKQNLMLSSFFWGILATQVVAGQLAERYGPKWFLAATFFLGSLFCVLLPPFGSLLGYEGVIVCRVIQGLCQGFVFPCLQNLIGKWCPLVDRATVCGFSYAGVPLGTMIAMPIMGLISDSKGMGWPVAYYLLGGFGIAWSVIWMVVGSDCPSKNRFISDSEKDYITSGLKPEEEELEKNSLLSALPYLVFWLLSIIMGFVADFLILRKFTSITTSRRIFNSIGMFIPSITLRSLGFVDSTDRILSVILLVISVGCTAGIFSGFIVNNVDLSPNYAGTLMGLANTASTVFSLMAPLYIDAIMQVTGYHESNHKLWTIVFCTSAGIFVIVGIFFIFASSGNVQKWNSPDYLENSKIAKKNCSRTK